MKQIKLFLFAFFIAFSFPHLFTIAAQAQDESCPNHRACEVERPQAGHCRIYLDAPTGAPTRLSLQQLSRSVNGVSRMEPPGCYDPESVYALAGWRYNLRGGAKIQQIRFLQGRTGLNFAFADKDGGELSDGYVWLHRLPEGTLLRTAKRTSCRTSCTVYLGQEYRDSFVVILGFDFRRQDGDGHVRRIGLTSTGFGHHVFNAAFADDDFLFDVEVQYAIIQNNERYIRYDSNARYNRDGAQYDRNRARNPNFVHPRLTIGLETPLIALSAFHFNFSNGGHFLEDFGIEPRRSDFASGLEFWFQDNQSEEDLRFPDDPFSWSASYNMLP